MKVVVTRHVLIWWVIAEERIVQQAAEEIMRVLSDHEPLESGVWSLTRHRCKKYTLESQFLGICKQHNLNMRFINILDTVEFTELLRNLEPDTAN